MSDDAPFDPTPKARAPRAAPKFWRRVCAFLGITAASLTVATLVGLKDQLRADWQTSLGHFKWAVLVSGDAVDVDEVGRYLKQLDGVGPVTLQPPSAIADQLKNEPLLADQISVLDPASLPSVWSVAWTADFDPSKLVDNVQELKRYPGVVDVAFDGRELDKASAYRVLYLRLRVLLSALAVIGAALLAILLGRFLFFTPLRSLDATAVAVFAFGAMVAWGCGLGLAWWLIGPFSWKLAWGAPVVALARLAWGRVRAAE